LASSVRKILRQRLTSIPEKSCWRCSAFSNDCLPRPGDEAGPDWRAKLPEGPWPILTAHEREALRVTKMLLVTLSKPRCPGRLSPAGAVAFGAAWIAVCCPDSSLSDVANDVMTSLRQDEEQSISSPARHSNFRRAALGRGLGSHAQAAPPILQRHRFSMRCDSVSMAGFIPRTTRLRMMPPSTSPTFHQARQEFDNVALLDPRVAR